MNKREMRLVESVELRTAEKDKEIEYGEGKIGIGIRTHGFRIPLEGICMKSKNSRYS